MKKRKKLQLRPTLTVIIITHPHQLKTIKKTIQTQQHLIRQQLNCVNRRMEEEEVYQRIAATQAKRRSSLKRKFWLPTFNKWIEYNLVTPMINILQILMAVEFLHLLHLTIIMTNKSQRLRCSDQEFHQRKTWPLEILITISEPNWIVTQLA